MEHQHEANVVKRLEQLGIEVDVTPSGMPCLMFISTLRTISPRLWRGTTGTRCAQRPLSPTSEVVGTLRGSRQRRVLALPRRRSGRPSSRDMPVSSATGGRGRLSTGAGRPWQSHFDDGVRFLLSSPLFWWFPNKTEPICEQSQPRLLLFSLHISSHHSARGEAVAPIEVFHPSFPPPHSPLGSPQEVERFFRLLRWQDDLSMRKGLLPSHLWQQASLIHTSSPSSSYFLFSSHASRQQART